MWLLTNSRSGSNSEQALDLLQSRCDEHRCPIVRTICFPDDELPTSRELDEAKVYRLAVFTGDGTLNAAITGLYGWQGEILVLPGGTMNLLSKRLHGPDAGLAEIIERVSSGAASAARPMVARCEAGDALADLLVGPGTAWAGVREAMRDLDLPAIAEETSDAIIETTGGAMVRCHSPQLGDRQGYPLIEFTPSHRGIQLDAFHAENSSEFLQQSIALLKRNFREGPHTRLGIVSEIMLETVNGGPLDILIDGEPARLGPRAKFTVAPCKVDLLATHHGF